MVQGLDMDLGLRTRTCRPRTRHGLEVQGQGRVVQGLDKDLGLRTRTRLVVHHHHHGLKV